MMKTAACSNHKYMNQLSIHT